jgi:hypothetical protein
MDNENRPEGSSALENGSCQLELGKHLPSCSDDHKHLVQERQVMIDCVRQSLRQSRISFNLTLTLMGVNTLVTVMGVGLLLLGNLPEGTLITTVGLFSNIVTDSRQLGKDSNQNLNRMIDRIKELEEG